MLPHRLEDIDQALIEQLCTDKCPESQVLEFKRELPAIDADGREELAKDVCAFANAAGGDLVYGVADANACASKVMSISGEKSDAAKRRMQEILDARIEPRVLGLQIHELKLGDGYGLVLRVPASFNGPHRYADDDRHTRFVVRSGTRTSELTYPQLRTAFDRTATLFERARQFRAERLAQIAAGRAPQPLVDEPLCVVHLLPLMAMDGRERLDIEPFYFDHTKYAHFRYEDWGNALERALNIDGLVVRPSRPDVMRHEAYVQVFRSGAFESVRCVGSSVEGRKVIWASTLCWHVRDSIEKFLAAARDISLGGPAAISVTLLRTTSYHFERMRGVIRTTPQADRADLVIPERWIDRLEAVENVDEVARPMLDLVYQCFNVPKCEAYDQNGRWQPSSRY